MRHLSSLLVGCGLLVGCAAGEPAAPKADAGDAAATDAEQPKLSEFDTLWDYNDPAGTRAKFEALLDEASRESPYDLYLQLLTQIARTHGLQSEFETARSVLEEVEGRRRVAPDDVPPVVHVRYLLELGRTWNSADEPSTAVPFFLDAWELAKREKLHYHAVDAAHMLGIVTAGADSLSWNRRAMEYAEKSGNARAQRWLGPLYNNIGWTYHDMGRFEQALEMWEKGLAFRKANKHSQESVWIADWTVARAHRSLGRHDDALTRLRRIEKARAAAAKPSGFVLEEIAENLHAQGKTADARPWFAKAWEALSKEAWLVKSDPERIARIRELSHQSD
jgi:tetratricopeptide (TPR) repeat protein